MRFRGGRLSGRAPAATLSSIRNPKCCHPGLRSGAEIRNSRGTRSDVSSFRLQIISHNSSIINQTLPLPMGRVARIVPEFCVYATPEDRVTPCARRNRRFFARGVFHLLDCCRNLVALCRTWMRLSLCRYQRGDSPIAWPPDRCPRPTQPGRPALSADTPNAINAVFTPSFYLCGPVVLVVWHSRERNPATVPSTDSEPVLNRAKELAGKRLAHRGPGNWSQ